jgi:hypothetical protein
MAGELTISIRLEWDGDSISDGSRDYVDESIDVASTDVLYKREEVTSTTGANMLSQLGYTYALGGYLVAWNAGNPLGAAKPVYIASNSSVTPLVRLLDGGIPAIFRVSPNATSLRALIDAADTGESPILEWFYTEA